MTLSKRNLFLLTLLLIAGVAVLTLNGWPTQNAPPGPRYRTQTVDRGDIVQIISANGTLNPVVLVNVGIQPA